MNAVVHRPRGIVVVRANAPGVVDELNRAFASFKQRHDERQTNIENSLDEISHQVAAFRVGGGGGSPSRNGPSAAALSAFGQFAKSGKAEAMKDFLPNASIAGTTDSDPNGGYLVPDEVSTTIIGRQINASPMRRLATVRVTKAAAYKQLVGVGGGTAEWVGEKQARPQNDINQYREITITPMEVYANPAVSQTLLDDADFDVATEVSGEIAKDFDLKEGVAWVSGDGVSKPRGFLSYATPVTTADATRAFGTLQYFPSGVAAALSDSTHNGGDALLDVVYGLKGSYRANATWLMNSTTVGTVRKLKDAENRYLWAPPIAAGQPATLLGYPVETDENMPDIGAGNFPIAFGDWKAGYMIVDRVGVRVLRDPFTNKPYVHFYTTKRVGGGLLHSNAIKLLKIAAT